MKHLKIAAMATVIMSGAAHAGGFERTDQSVSVLFEEGRYLELGFSAAFPDVSGVGALVTPGQHSGNMAENYQTYRLAFKDDINDSFSYAIIFDQPYGTNLSYPASTYFAGHGDGASASITTNAVTGILQYNFPDEASPFGGNLSIYGGARAQLIDAEASIPFLNNYVASVDEEIGFGYLLGFAYEKPELGMRISLTYSSEISTQLDTTESFAGGQASNTSTGIDTPESVNLEFQTGLNRKTLLFGSVRWVPWGDFEINPPLYVGATGSPLASFEDDRITYRLGLGRRITENLSIFAAIGYEESTGSATTNFTPIDGFTSYTLGANYTIGRARITLAGRYGDIGGADTRLGAAVPAGQFRENEVWGVGVKVGFDLN